MSRPLFYASFEEVGQFIDLIVEENETASPQELEECKNLFNAVNAQLNGHANKLVAHVLLAHLFRCIGELRGRGKN